MDSVSVTESQVGLFPKLFDSAGNSSYLGGEISSCKNVESHANDCSPLQCDCCSVISLEVPVINISTDVNTSTVVTQYQHTLYNTILGLSKPPPIMMSS